MLSAFLSHIGNGASKENVPKDLGLNSSSHLTLPTKGYDSAFTITLVSPSHKPQQRAEPGLVCCTAPCEARPATEQQQRAGRRRNLLCRQLLAPAGGAGHQGTIVSAPDPPIMPSYYACCTCTQPGTPPQCHSPRMYMCIVYVGLYEMAINTSTLVIAKDCNAVFNEELH